MRYDLVVNTFVKDALSMGRMTVHYGGAMWRPLVDVKDVARAYVMALESDTDLIRGQIFNLTSGNFRISELALRAEPALAHLGPGRARRRLYLPPGPELPRVGGEGPRVLGFQPRVSMEESVEHMVKEIARNGMTRTSRTPATTTSSG